MNVTINNKLQVSAINNGTVIDRIPSQALFKVIEILRLGETEHQITFGTNLDSRKLGKKAIIKISDSYFEEEDMNRIALFAPSAKFNIIKDYKVVEKKQVSIPEQLHGIAKCFNPKCITNHQLVETSFSTKKDKNGISLLCHYCEKITHTKNLQIISK